MTDPSLFFELDYADMKSIGYRLDSGRAITQRNQGDSYETQNDRQGKCDSLKRSNSLKIARPNHFYNQYSDSGYDAHC